MKEKKNMPKRRSGPKRTAKAVRKQGFRWTAMQRQFVKEYPRDLNAGKAAERAGASPKGARQTGHRWLTNADIADAIAKELAARSVRTQITADDVVQRLQLLADARINKATNWTTSMDDNGVIHTDIIPVDSEDLGPAESAAIRGIKMGRNGLEIRFSDPAPYLRMLGEHTGLFEAGQQQQQMIQVNIVVVDKREVKR